MKNNPFNTMLTLAHQLKLTEQICNYFHRQFIEYQR